MPESTAAGVSPIGRVSFAHVFKAKDWDDGKDPMYEITLIFPPDADLSQLEAFEESAAKGKWPKGKPKGYTSPIHDAGEKAELDGYDDDGSRFIRFASKSRPAIVGPDKSNLGDGEFYSGCFARVSYGEPFAYDNKGNKGVTYGYSLLNIQKTGDGESFSGGSSDAQADFGEVEGADQSPDEDVTVF